MIVTSLKDVHPMINFMISGKESHLQDVIQKLKFISKVRVGEKIDVKSMSIVRPRMYDRLHRVLISRETKDDTIHFLKTTLNEAVEMLYYYAQSANRKSPSEKFDIQEDGVNACDENAFNVLWNNITQSLEGIRCLTETYVKSHKFICAMETLLQTTVLKLS